MEGVNNRTRDQQFKVGVLKTSAPINAGWIERDPGAGLIRGIGPLYAKKLVRGFEEPAFDIIEGRGVAACHA